MFPLTRDNSKLYFKELLINTGGNLHLFSAMILTYSAQEIRLLLSSIFVYFSALI